MKVTKKVSLGVEMKDFYKNAFPLVPKKQLHEAIKNELDNSIQGMINGEWGGIAVNWQAPFYRNLVEDGYIRQTQRNILRFGNFSEI